MDSMKRPTFFINTLGCKANTSDSQTLAGRLFKAGMLSVQNPKEADWIVVNSCSVTDEADKQSRAAAKKLKKINPDAKLVVTGCGAEINPEQFSALSAVDYVVGNQNKNEFVSLIQQSRTVSNGKILGGVVPYDTLRSSHPMDREWPTSHEDFYYPAPAMQKEQDAATYRTRAFLKIQEGCDSFCTYCIIPYGRGPSRSLPLLKVVEIVKELEAAGTEEVVLTATNLGDYEYRSEFENFGRKSGLEQLIAAILHHTQNIRVRLSSLDPIELEAGVLDLLENEQRLCAHVHLSVQSVDSEILKLMKRKYRSDVVSRVLQKIENISSKRPLSNALFVGMDLITGFPGETEDIFKRGLEFLQAHPWSRLHVFPYSERARTPATKLPHSVEKAERYQRSRALNQLSLQRLKQKYEGLVHQKVEGILWEKGAIKKDGAAPDLQFLGYSKNYIRCVFRPSEDGAYASLRKAGGHLREKRLPSTGRVMGVELNASNGEASAVVDFS